ncbi:4-amino-4-deoxychorismate lyase [Hoeflea marina]|uniref:Probable branched-chain-amino-acid aminotransferase n=1 Tax=Hoeflea marina TaxID=274592 RepID=A0A317PDG9_9HYPH|nr:aminotransferase class IV family protein [Hoeflea marina]PWV97232.1 4-amino-4-deoxychorismate lyase [Hoeflea marina]
MQFTLIETFRWEPQTGFVRLDQHLRRLSRSADALGFRQPTDAPALLDALETGDTPLRVRMSMNFRGRIEITTSPFAPLPEGTVWKLRLASARLNSEDSLYRHKTSRREPYEAARAEFKPEEADEVLMLNERGELCEGTITNLFVGCGDGTFLTPALSSGLLPGVLRAEMIRERKAMSRVLLPADLVGRPLYVGNSLRGLIRAEFIEEQTRAEAIAVAHEKQR